eukprot:TRINITY_DN13772_c0_g1_i3.p1 TRINITY_DN13772_c0_g1~~TRINITY_DN13772_c0_g1_i3.p1  ORF type:complete len:645 (-),score=122.27 TRINITY_DN13772_c0_g1_i3:60-1994(-)
MHVETLQDLIISGVVIPRLTVENCLMYLLESYKKLKACETSSDSWFLLLNRSLTLTSANFEMVLQSGKRDAISKLEERLVEEIVERFLQVKKRELCSPSLEVLQFLLSTKKTEDCLELVQSRRSDLSNLAAKQTGLATLKILSQSSKVFNELESEPFELAGLYFKVIITPAEDMNDAIEVYLLFDRQTTLSKPAQYAQLPENIGYTFDLDSASLKSPSKTERMLRFKPLSNQEILSQRYFTYSKTDTCPDLRGLLSIAYECRMANRTTTQSLKTLHTFHTPLIILDRFRYQVGRIFDLTIILSTDLISSALLTVGSSKFTLKGTTHPDDLKAIVTHLSGSHSTSDALLLSVCDFFESKAGISAEYLEDVLFNFDFQNVSAAAINKLVSSPMLRISPKVIHFIESLQRIKSEKECRLQSPQLSAALTKLGSFDNVNVDTREASSYTPIHGGSLGNAKNLARLQTTPSHTVGSIDQTVKACKTTPNQVFGRSNSKNVTDSGAGTRQGVNTAFNRCLSREDATPQKSIDVGNHMFSDSIRNVSAFKEIRSGSKDVGDFASVRQHSIKTTETPNKFSINEEKVYYRVHAPDGQVYVTDQPPDLKENLSRAGVFSNGNPAKSPSLLAKTMSKNPNSTRDNLSMLSLIHI